MELSLRQKKIIEIILAKSNIAIGEIISAIEERFPKSSKPTINRDIANLLDKGLIIREGQGPSTTYSISKYYCVICPVDLDSYFQDDFNDRRIKKTFNFGIFDLLSNVDIFSDEELSVLDGFEKEFRSNISDLSDTIKKKEIERITIELSWKSSAIEGNTYSLLETETLIKEGIEATGKKQEEAIMILNHKKALDYIFLNADKFKVISICKIEDVHKVLVDRLGVSANIRKTLVGITGTNYKPLDNVFQIHEALEKMCDLINDSENKFVKSFLAFVLLAYIQPFEDGNKRVSRIMANAILLAHGSFPLALRSIDETLYKQSMLLFYEMNNISAMKKIFLEQAEFSAKSYFQVKIK